MPTYEYQCKTCGLDLEVVQSFTDDALTTCEACGGQLRKVFGNVGIAFKGSGFYKNDSRGKTSATASSTDKGTDKGTEAGSGSTDKGGAGTDAGSTTTSDGAAASGATTSPSKADKAKTSSTTT